MIWLKNPDFRFRHLTDAITVEYNNEMIARVEFTPEACIRDIFVDVRYREQGLGRHLVRLVEQATGVIPTAMPPVSELGRRLFPWSL